MEENIENKLEIKKGWREEKNMFEYKKWKEFEEMKKDVY